MNKSIKIKIIILFLFLALVADKVNSQFLNTNRISIGFGIGTGSYVGADFGSAFYMSFFNTYDDYYNYNNYYYSNYNSGGVISPIIVDMGTSIDLNEFVSVAFDASFIWHLFGRPRRDFQTGTSGNRNYLDRWDNNYLYAVPLFLSLKLYPFGKSNYPLYISGGYGTQYTVESLDRVREYYNYNNYYSNYSIIMNTVEDNAWFQGFKISFGFRTPVNYFMSNETEIKLTNFVPVRDSSSPLAMRTTTNITFIGMTTKFCFDF